MSPGKQRAKRLSQLLRRHPKLAKQLPKDKRPKGHK